MGTRSKLPLILAFAVVACACQEPVRQADIPEELPVPKKRFDLNTVTLEELLSARKEIVGLSTRVARNIVEFRQGFSYRRVEDLLAVERIGEKTFLKIRRYFYVSRSRPQSSSGGSTR